MRQTEPALVAALLRRALELSPGFTAARANLALVLYRMLMRHFAPQRAARIEPLATKIAPR